MKRVVDEAYYTYSVYTAMSSGIAVKCPHCGGLGVVTADARQAYFQCQNCGASRLKERTVYRYDVHNQCSACGRYYRVDVTNKSQAHFRMLRVACPYCGQQMAGRVHKTAEASYYLGEIKNAREPFFEMELWFVASFDGKLVWALNREHLAYLIHYLSASLRQKPAGYRALKTQADHLPTFMKRAKNRNKIVRLLKKLQEQ